MHMDVHNPVDDVQKWGFFAPKEDKTRKTAINSSCDTEKNVVK